ncbi:hypothetical protein [uncultured Vagococcus sp.]|uniref:type IV toxin-antitoxin system AbiEi family antitoxin domain-containing protein n=1 Tax=uncultured Vagococcus sp. TaxID=189676 RepID=UPI0028D3883A|nr:hypothetical protein [uncultured Vagococcus sp.]
MFENDYEIIVPFVFKKESAPEDVAFILSKKYPKLVYSHETALYYHSLSDVYPYFLHATVENNYNPRLTIYGEEMSIVRSRQLIESEEVEYVATSLGNYIPITDRERTICDFFHQRYKMDHDVKSKILSKYFSSTGYSPKKLKRKAKKLGVWEKMEPIVEVLLNYE